MNLFAWLLMGHLVGDWLLQNDWMARGKKRGLFTLAVVVHVAIYTAAIGVVLGFCGCGDMPWTFYLGWGSVVFVSHWLIDATGLAERWMRFYRQTDLEIVRVMVDQTLHLVVLAAILRFFN